MALDVVDRRVLKTQTALRRAFFDLIRVRGYQAVSVGDIIAAADVGRSTFYEHFRGKEDILRASMRHIFSTLADVLIEPAPNDQLRATTAHLWENRGLAREIFVGAPRLILSRAHAELVRDRLARLVLERRERPLIPLSLAAQQIAEGQIVLVHGWLTGKSRVTADAIAEALHASARAASSALL